jgi:hypothetical protein
MGGFDSLQFTLNGIRQVLAADAGLFVPVALSMVRYGTAIALAWFGAQIVLNGMGDELFAKLVGLILLFGFVYLMLVYYTAHIPGVGASFPGVISGGTEWMAQRIGEDAANDIMQRSAGLYSSLEVPSVFTPLAWLNYIVIWLCLLLLNVVVFFSQAIGLLMSAVWVIFGPVAVATLVIPHFDFLFWNWLKSYLAFCLLQPFAAALVKILANILVPAFDSLPPMWSIHDQIALAVGMVTMVVALAFVAFKLPMYCSMMVSGQSGGESLAEKIGSAAVRAVSKGR